MEVLTPWLDQRRKWSIPGNPCLISVFACRYVHIKSNPVTVKVNAVKFRAKIRAKKRLSRLQRLARSTRNQVRGKYLRPVYLEDFCLRVPPLEDMIPKEDTVDISDMLSRIKKDVSATYLDD
jgi:hypothetical protein